MQHIVLPYNENNFSVYLAYFCLSPLPNDVIDNLHSFQVWDRPVGLRILNTHALTDKGHRDLSVNLWALFMNSAETVFVDCVVLLVLSPERA